MTWERVRKVACHMEERGKKAEDNRASCAKHWSVAMPSPPRLPEVRAAPLEIVRPLISPEIWPGAAISITVGTDRRVQRVDGAEAPGARPRQPERSGSW